VYSRRKHIYTGGYVVHTRGVPRCAGRNRCGESPALTRNGDVPFEGGDIQVIFVCDVPHGISWTRRKGFSQQSRIEPIILSYKTLLGTPKLLVCALACHLRALEYTCYQISRGVYACACSAGHMWWVYPNSLSSIFSSRLICVAYLFGESSTRSIELYLSSLSNRHLQF
jgi:hypothetical protein